jgi:hypothetical protein
MPVALRSGSDRSDEIRKEVARNVTAAAACAAAGVSGKLRAK